jgi:hypothetical protein
MKKHLSVLVLLFLTLGLASVRAQLGTPGGGPMNDVMTKVFGTNLNFSANMEAQVKTMPKPEDISMSGKIYFANGNSRTEMDMTKMKGSNITPQVIAQLKSMGLDKLVSISQTGKKVIYVIYPGVQAYTKMNLPGADSVKTNDYTVETVELGKETLDGHPCVKNKYTVTNNKTGQRLVMTSWNATDLKNCPIKIEQSAWTSSDSFDGSITTMHLTDINLTKPDASLFEPPVGFKAYDDMQTMMQTEMMKKMGGGMGKPPGS